MAFNTYSFVGDQLLAGSLEYQEQVTQLNDTAGNGAALAPFDRCTKITANVAGVFASGTVTMQGAPDGVTFAGLPTAVTFTAAGVAVLPDADLGMPAYRFVLSGGGATTSLTCVLRGVRRPV